MGLLVGTGQLTERLIWSNLTFFHSLTGSCAYRIKQKRYSLANILGVFIVELPWKV
jgi:hypothetical protein